MQGSHASFSQSCNILVIGQTWPNNQNAHAGADPGPVLGGGANPLDGGANPIYFILFLKNPMKLKKFWSVGGGARWERPPPLDPPLPTSQNTKHWTTSISDYVKCCIINFHDFDNIRPRHRKWRFFSSCAKKQNRLVVDFKLLIRKELPELSSSWVLTNFSFS